MASLQDILSPDELHNMLNLKGSLPVGPAPGSAEDPSMALSSSTGPQPPQNVLDNGITAVQAFYGQGGEAKPMPSTDTTAPIADLLPPNSSSASDINNLLAPISDTTNVPSDEDTAATASAMLRQSSTMPTRMLSKDESEDDSEDRDSQQNDYLDKLIKQAQSGQGIKDLLLAQKAQGDMNSIAGYGIAGQQLGAALSKGAIKPDYTAQQHVVQMGEQGVKNVQAQQAYLEGQIKQGLQVSDLQDKEEQRDANSDLSVSTRHLAKSMGLPVGENASYEQIVKTQPMMDTYMKMQLMKAQKSYLMSLQEKKLYDTAEQKYTAGREQLYSQRGAVGRSAQVMQAAQKLEALANQYKDKDAIPPPLMQSAAADFATIMQNGGVPHQDEMRVLMPPSLSSKISTLGSFFDSHPTGAGMGAYMNMLSDTANELQGTAKKYAQDHEKVFLNGFKSSLRPDFYTSAKKRVDDMMDSQSSVGPYASAIAQFRKLHPESKLTDDEIASYLGGKK